MKIIRHRLPAKDDKYKFRTRYRKKVAVAYAMGAASLASGVSLISSIRNTSNIPAPVKAVSIADSAVSTVRSFSKTIKSVLGQNPHSFNAVYVEKMKKVNKGK